jgi:hypothetical protein
VAVRRSFAAASAFLALAAVSAPGLAACPSEAGDCVPILESGTSGASIDLAIVGDGYTMAERDKFFQDAQKIALGLLESETYGPYKPIFNAWALFTPSNQSGADHPASGQLVDTAFDASYDTAGIDYLLAVNTFKVNAELATRFPEKDLSMCIVNATPYGGSGGDVAVISLHPQSIEIARHELGHTLANLADEYPDPYPGFPDGDSEPNVVTTNHLDPLKWEMWLTPGVAVPTPIGDMAGPHDPVGAYEGARYKSTGVFRPTPNCLMRALDVTFCQVCAEAMVKEFSRLSLLIDAPVPASPAKIPAAGPTAFTATIPALAGLTFTWSVDGQMVAETSKSLGLDPKALGLADGSHQVSLTIYDPTPLVRNDPEGLMKETFTWDVVVDSTLPGPTTSGSGGTGGEGGAGVGGNGGSGGVGDDGTCGCHLVGQQDAPEPIPWFLMALAPVVYGARRRQCSARDRRAALPSSTDDHLRFSKMRN